MRGRSTLAAVTAAGLTLTGLVVASGAQAAAVGNPIVIRVSSSRISFSSGSTIRPGTRNFKVVSVDGRDHTVQIVRLHQGYTLAQAKTDVNKAFSGDTAAIRRIDDRITWRGGVEAHKKAGWFSTTLSVARYVVLDQNSNAYRYLDVRGSRFTARVPAASGRVTAYSYGFGEAGRLPATGWVRLYNQSDQPHFFIFQHVKQGTTRRQVQRFFASGAQGNPSWGLRASTGSAVVSPYRGQTMHLALPAGEYLVACFWPDDDTGMPHAFMGMWDLVQLH